MRLTPEAADRIYEIARTAMPHQPGVALTRAEYFANTGRLKKAKALVTELKKRASLQANVWVLDMLIDLRMGDMESANRNLRHILTMKDDFGRRFLKGLEK